MPDVMAIASAPQNMTRKAALSVGVPPARAATAPNKARKYNEHSDTNTASCVSGHNG